MYLPMERLGRAGREYSRRSDSAVPRANMTGVQAWRWTDGAVAQPIERLGKAGRQELAEAA